MDNFILPLQVRWSDLDPNVHLRHSVYYDWGAQCRIDYLGTKGLTTKVLQDLHFGPILFREECIFKREVRLGDPVSIDLVLVKTRRDYSRWTMRHIIRKNPETVSAILTIEGAWMDIIQRKLIAPPAPAQQVMAGMPLAEDFGWAD